MKSTTTLKVGKKTASQNKKGSIFELDKLILPANHKGHWILVVDFIARDIASYDSMSKDGLGEMTKKGRCNV